MSPSFGSAQSLLSDLQEAACKSPSLMQFRDSFLDCLKGTLYAKPISLPRCLLFSVNSFGTSS